MKKYSLILAASILAAAMLAGCANKTEDTGEAQTETAAAESETKESETVESILDRDADGNFIKPENYGTVKKLGKYKGLEVTLDDATVTDQDVEDEIQGILEAATELEAVDREAKLGDYVNIDYVGKKDGVAFDGGTAQGYDLGLGTGTFIAGFEDGLVGTKKGDVVDLNLTFPENYKSEELAGQDVVFTVTVNEVKEKNAPELTDEWVKEYTGGEITNVEDFRKECRSQLELYKKQDAEAMAQSDLIAQVINDSEFEPTVEAIEYEYQTMIGMYDQYAAMMGMTTDEYLEAYGVDPSAMKLQLSYYAEESVKQRLMENAIIEAEGLQVSDKDKQALADQYGYSVEEMESIYGDQFADYARSYMVVRYIYENAVKK
ncbi:MAG: trigger factor [Lachnospiraceae bacterium]|nr:trigger factor [Lachnospiraceae bacterium]